LFHPRDKVLSEEAYERLRTIGETTDLGSGFKIAMRDLEIRGAGNLLGEAQSGHIAAVGYDLYCQMVTEAVSEMKGETTVEESEIKVDISIDAHLPNDYVPSEDLRLEAYRKLATVRTATELADIEKEWRDRFGPLPEPAQSLMQVAALRVECLRIGITEIVMNGLDARLSPITLRASQTRTLRRLAPRAVFKETTGVLTVPISRGENPAVALTSMLCELFEPDDH
jgi:transcription-repair coupling factor (superfamily II helicase)